MADNNQGDFAQPLVGLVQQQSVTVSSAITGGLADVQKDGVTVDAAIRSKLNFITGTNTTLTVADNSGSDRVDVTVAADLSLTARTLDYVKATSNITVAATTEATATTVITGTSKAYDSSEKLIEFWAPHFRYPSSANSVAHLVFLRGSTVLGQAVIIETDSANAPSYIGAKKFEFVDSSPTAGTYSYAVKAFVDRNTLTIWAGAGGSGNQMPAFLRVS